MVLNESHIHCEHVFGIVGENFTFPVQPDKKIVEIIWTKNKDIVAEWEGQNKPTYFTSLRNRGLLNKENGCLTIFNLEDNDTGTYVLDYLDSEEKSYALTFVLAVLPPPSEPEITCNISDTDLVLKCTADFQKPLDYTWKFSSTPTTRHTQEFFIPMKDVGGSEKATCFIKFSQTERSSEISLTQCFPDKKGGIYHKRSRHGLTAAFVLFILLLVGAGILYKRAISSQDVDYQNERPEADKELNEEYSALKDKRMVNSDVNQEEETQGAEGGNGEHLRNVPSCSEEEETQGAEGGNGEHLRNVPSCSEEDLKL
ncbi:lymphocyte function-associated antigen 3 isoform X2 [Opisthocomus hoazin]|uniref:lymphocyte function-associated antigen 3 isoform X2 n=1 Tax=Opisthocomus hoazin TaxID=30419 RepID=UPI003F537992